MMEFRARFTGDELTGRIAALAFAERLDEMGLELISGDLVFGPESNRQVEDVAAIDRAAKKIRNKFVLAPGSRAGVLTGITVGAASTPSTPADAIPAPAPKKRRTKAAK